MLKMPANPSNEGKSSKTTDPENGYLLIGALFLVAVVLITLAVAAPQVASEIQRDKELELYHRGLQYQHAIRLYYKKFGRYPNNLEQLEKTNEIRFLRKRYKDPVTGKDEWRMIHFGEQKVKTTGLFGQPIAATGTNGLSTPGTPTNGPGGSAFGGSNSGSAFGSNSGSAFGSNSGSAFGSNSGSAFGSSGGSTSAFGGSTGTSAPTTGTGTAATGTDSLGSRCCWESRCRSCRWLKHRYRRRIYIWNLVDRIRSDIWRRRNCWRLQRQQENLHSRIQEAEALQRVGICLRPCVGAERHGWCSRRGPAARKSQPERYIRQRWIRF